ncbi:MAG TPA: phosphoglucomutase, alpha-D-glucose phosphate-specific, partial [Polyangiaceae bacterium]|nr:phosphoglucomutase, alpha-D-glucose phosphate-specific [Polyangiaceae bacterium]
MAISPLAGKPAPESALIDVSKLVRAFYEEHPDPASPAEGVSFGTSGHRGSALRRSFNEDHIVAITHAICDYRATKGTDGTLYLGKDTHALSEPASRVACE